MKRNFSKSLELSRVHSLFFCFGLFGFFFGGGLGFFVPQSSIAQEGISVNHRDVVDSGKKIFFVVLTL